MINDYHDNLDREKLYPRRIINEEVWVSVDLTAQILYCRVKLTVDISYEKQEYVDFDFAIDNVEKCQVNQIDTNFEYISSVSNKDEALSQIETKSFQLQDLEQKLSSPFVCKPCLRVFLPNKSTQEQDLTKEASPPSSNDTLDKSGHQNTVYNIQVTYLLSGSNASVLFRQFDSHSYVYIDGFFTGAYHWIPCVDNLCNRYTFTLIISVATDLFAVASGDVEDTILSDDETSVAYYYRVGNTLPCNVSFIVGPFKVLPDPVYPASITYFALPGNTKWLANTTRFLSKLVPKMQSVFPQVGFPFSSFKIVFLGKGDGRHGQGQSFAGGLCLVPGDWLYGEDIIDQVFYTRPKLVNLFCSLYIGDNGLLGPQTAKDIWLIHGLQQFLGMHLLKDLFGNNWCKTRYLELAQYLYHSLDGGGCLVNDDDHLRSPNLYKKTAKVRSLLIIYMISKRMSTQSIISAVEKMILTHMDSNGKLSEQSHVTEEMVDLVSNFVSTLSSRNVHAMIDFISRWTRSCDILKLRCGYRYDSKKKFVELAVKQSIITFRSQDGKRIERDLDGDSKVSMFKGGLTVQVMEMEGAHDHLLEMDSDILLVELPTSTRRMKQHHRKRSKSSLKESDTVIPPTEANLDEEGVIIEKDPVLWVRIDPDQEWILKFVEFRRSERDSISCLRNCRDVWGQLEALETLMSRTKGRVSVTSIRCLEQILTDSRYYFQVRGECARCLAKCYTTNDRLMGLEALLKLLRNKYFDKHGAVLSNHFDDISEYFVKCAVIQAIAQAIHPISFPIYGYDSQFSLNLASFQMTHIQESLPYDVLQLLLSLLEQNDTAYPPLFDDCFYLHNLIIACAICSVYAKDQITRHRVYKQLFRYLKREEAMPSYHNIITGASLKGLTILQLGGFLRIPNDWEPMVVSETEGLVSSERESNDWEKALWKSFRSCNLLLIKIAMECLFHLYGGHIEFLEWLLEAWIENRLERYERTRRSAIRLLQKQVALRATLRNRLRKYDEQSIHFCLRWLRWMVEEKDCLVQSEGLKVAKHIWGSYIPLCLLTNEEYERERNERKKSHKERKELDYRLEGRKMVVLPARDQSSSFSSPTSQQQPSELGVENVQQPKESSALVNEQATQEQSVEKSSFYLMKEMMERIKETCDLDSEDEHYMLSFLEQGCQGAHVNSVKVSLRKFGLEKLLVRWQQQKSSNEFQTPKEFD
ncbi:transcription initiation factor TFIID subunit D2 [Galdieria sulphuraria]|uniref:Transcription initiation factor TFIID subunit 2 n=1 Tax=Galdieria sulphuraria TaxID=130081 RepID=M2W5A2_GALSU|nr:transcription initiation factor TFIID subunit D2 [Galdieria sulphuraria]EME30946.1 transcription initiation factor TFIID subunit D2 [Galdieria sulphuraria]|eukprot:XP_005707466.1 transcription initiation factor TFIID subunit D2 [Galdieria sulphuraria]